MKSKLRHLHSKKMEDIEDILDRRVSNYVMINVEWIESKKEFYAYFMLPDDVYFSANNDHKAIKELEKFKEENLNRSK